MKALEKSRDGACLNVCTYCLHNTIAGPAFAEGLPQQTLRINKLCGTEVMPIGDN